MTEQIKQSIFKSLVDILEKRLNKIMNNTFEIEGKVFYYHFVEARKKLIMEIESLIEDYFGAGWESNEEALEFYNKHAVSLIEKRDIRIKK